MAGAERAAPGRGRPCDRYLLLKPHPLHDTHVLVRKSKLGVPAWTGAPPPKDASAGDEGEAAERKRTRYAQFMVANFVPWHVPLSVEGEPLEPHVELTYERWIEHMAELEYDACCHREREADVEVDTPKEMLLELEIMRDERLLAAGRLFDIENLNGGFTVSLTLASAALTPTRYATSPSSSLAPDCFHR